MSEVKSTRTVLVTNSQGLHLRPANLIIDTAKKYQAKIELVRENTRVDGKSIMELITLGATPGTSISIEATGPDSDAAVEAIAALFAANFFEDQPEQSA